MKSELIVGERKSPRFKLGDLVDLDHEEDWIFTVLVTGGGIDDGRFSGIVVWAAEVATCSIGEFGRDWSRSRYVLSDRVVRIGN